MISQWASVRTGALHEADSRITTLIGALAGRAEAATMQDGYWVQGEGWDDDGCLRCWACALKLWRKIVLRGDVLGRFDEDVSANIEPGAEFLGVEFSDVELFICDDDGGNGHDTSEQCADCYAPLHYWPTEYCVETELAHFTAADTEIDASPNTCYELEKLLSGMIDNECELPDQAAIDGFELLLGKIASALANAGVLVAVVEETTSHV